MQEKVSRSDIRPESSAWKALCNDPNTGVVVIDADGAFQYANNQAVTLIFGTDEPASKKLIGRSITDVLPPVAAADRWRAISKVFKTGTPVLFRSICKGYQNHTWMQPIRNSPEDQVHSVLLTIRRASDDAAVESPVIYEYECAQVNDLGELEVLSSREIEVLAMLGIRAVADALKRSSKTIEKHRDSISRKLKAKTRADLVRLVQQAGLTRADAARRGTA